MPQTRKDTAYWMLGDPESLRLMLKQMEKIIPFLLDHPKAKELILEDDARTDADREMDCAFLDDQYKARKMVMGKTDKLN